jgi:hypothetical protein
LAENPAAADRAGAAEVQASRVMVITAHFLRDADGEVGKAAECRGWLSAESPRLSIRGWAAS